MCTEEGRGWCGCVGPDFDDGDESGGRGGASCWAFGVGEVAVGGELGFSVEVVRGELREVGCGRGVERGSCSACGTGDIWAEEVCEALAGCVFA